MNDSDTECDYQRAVQCLREDRPVPVDVIHRLLEAGIDYATLEDRYAV